MPGKSPRAATVRVAIEAGTRRVFASALDWPGWARSARDEAQAIEALAAYAARYRPVARGAGLRFPARPAFEVVERVSGNATTDFGAPGIVSRAEQEPPSAADARRLARLVEASWAALDAAAASAPAALRKGPRGGGRDRDAVVAHVLGSEAGYSRTLGLRLTAPAAGDRAAVDAFREAIAAAIRTPRAQPAATKSWPVRYAARRIAWHALDHAWEIEDRSTP